MGQRQSALSIFDISLRTRKAALFGCLLAVLTFVATAEAQTFTVLYMLNGTTGGNFPGNGLVADRQGNLYGAAEGGIENCGGGSCGIVFKLSRHGSGWTYGVIYYFTGESDGVNVMAPLTVGPDGTIYGVTSRGGNDGCFNGCGTVFRLTPPPNICPTVSCEWRKTTLYEFTGGNDGQYPLGQLTFDQAGNIYGTAYTSAPNNPYYGSVFELTPSGGGWTFNILYDFLGGDSGLPSSGVVFDRQGNLWGYQAYGGANNCMQVGDDCGSIYKLSPSPSGWTETNEFGFSASTGGGPSGNMLADQSGNFYGTLISDGSYGGGGVFQFVPSTGEFHLIYAVVGLPADNQGPYGGVVMDPAGNLYAADMEGGSNPCGGLGCGFIFELSPENGAWYFTNLHSFTGGSDGGFPVGPVALDDEGNVYGANLRNIIFEITP